MAEDASLSNSLVLDNTNSHHQEDVQLNGLNGHATLSEDLNSATPRVGSPMDTSIVASSSRPRLDPEGSDDQPPAKRARTVSDADQASLVHVRYNLLIKSLHLLNVSPMYSHLRSHPLPQNRVRVHLRAHLRPWPFVLRRQHLKSLGHLLLVFSSFDSVFQLFAYSANSKMRLRSFNPLTLLHLISPIILRL